jgi:hypothetical protein
VLGAALVLLPASGAFGNEGGYAVTWSRHASYQGYHVNLGPTGARGWVDGNRIHVVDVAKGSPAAGILQPYDVIVGANRKAFEEGADPRVALGNAITKSETERKAGKLVLSIRRNGEEKTVRIQLRVMGPYGATWPFGCAKSAKIVDNACAHLAAGQYPDGHCPGELGMATMWAGLLFVASGDVQYLDNARRAAYWLCEQSYDGVVLNNWPAGYSGIFLAEYYLATGDRTVLPQLKKLAALLSEGQMQCGSWGHSSPWGGYGAVNSVGLTCLMTLVLTEECGLRVDPTALRRSIAFFRKYAGRGWVPYGDHRPWLGANGNGKNALAAVVFDLLGDEEKAVRAFGRSVAASYAYREEGHTGCYFSLFWGPLAAVHAGERDFRTFLDKQRWYYDLARTHDGGLFCQPNGENLSGRTPGTYTWSGSQYTSGGMALLFALPRKTLRILGAPHSVFGRKLAGPLAKARTLYEQRKWEDMKAQLGSLARGKDFSADKRRWAGQLVAAAKQQQESVRLTLRDIERHVREEDAYRAAEQLASLERLLGKDDPELKAAQELLEANKQWVENGRGYFKAWSQLREYTEQYWTPYGKRAMAVLGRTGPSRARRWEPIVATSEAAPQTWRAFQWGDADAAAPQKDPTAGKLKGWEQVGFDDSAWAAGPGPIRAGKGKGTSWQKRHILLRKTFTLGDETHARLRLKLQAAKGQVAKVYLNGVLVAELVGATRRGYTAVPLAAKAAGLLKRGANCLAVHGRSDSAKGQSLDIGLDGAKDPLR